MRELTRVQTALGHELVSLGNRILELLVRYFPQAANLGNPYAGIWFINLCGADGAPALTTLSREICEPAERCEVQARSLIVRGREGLTSGTDEASTTKVEAEVRPP